MPSEPVYQHQQQTPVNGAISRMVPPGNETGYYYIPIASLPWQTSWQELKDHVRTVCPVEHVEINGDGTDGHVILKGRANFDAAFRLLNGGIFHDRALIADGRNADSWVLVLQHVDRPAFSPQPPVPSMCATTSAENTPLPTARSSPSYGEWHATSAGPSYVMSPAVDSSSYIAPCTMSEYTGSAFLYGMGGCALEHSFASALPYQTGTGYTQQYTPAEYYGNSYSMPRSDVASRGGKKYQGNSASTKRKKIIIRQLQPWANESQIRDLIRHRAGYDSEKLEKLDIPLADSRPGFNRGYVIATFESEDAAERVIKGLNNYEYEGRILEAKHTKESASDHHSSHGSRSGHQRHANHSRRERHYDKDKRGKEKEASRKASSPNEKKSEPSLSESDVIIAHGSSTSYL